MFEHASAWEVAKWAALVFAAGFIGFFGKSLGRALLGMLQKKETAAPETGAEPEGVSPPGEGLPQAAQDRELSKDEQKLVKKALKAQAKDRKKSS